ncbi:MlaD family protein [Methylotetracoccus oryzae]|uniref:MlaD family protein n=1 Tax=Methylotetracoccus oryzae TaxID=1919059 RepID=UPI00111A502D|nr:MlaD family protein [Methylotetracoccus oryzae]
MSKPVNPMAIGSFLLVGLGLLIAALLVFGGGEFFKPKLQWVVYFDSSLNGLNIGAPVKVQGVQVGTVADIVLQMDMKDKKLVKPVVLDIVPGTIVNPAGQPIQPALSDEERHQRLKALIDAGLRARLETQSLLTGLLYVDLNFYRGSAPTLTGLNYKDLPEVPSVPTTTEEVKNALEQTLQKVKDLPIDTMVQNLNATLTDLRTILASRETTQSREALARTLLESEKLLADLNRQLPPLIKDVGHTVKEANAAVKAAGGLMTDLRGESKPVLAAAEQALVKATVVLDETRNAAMNVADTTGSDSTLQQSLAALRDAARSIRQLSDTLERHPDSLIYGKPN